MNEKWIYILKNSIKNETTKTINFALGFHEREIKRYYLSRHNKETTEFYCLEMMMLNHIKYALILSEKIIRNHCE